jgi:hypothetical protein
MAGSRFAFASAFAFENMVEIIPLLKKSVSILGF